MKRVAKYLTGCRILSSLTDCGPGETFPFPSFSAPHPSSFILHPFPRRSGITLVEMMISVAIVSIALLGMIGSFKYLNIGIQTAKQKSLANNIAQEKMAYLKNKSYYRVLISTATATDSNFSPALVYDTAPNGIESITVGGITFERRVYIRKVSENTSGDLTYYSWNAPDTGLKEIAVYVVWRERGDWKKLELKNLVENPDRTNLSAAFSGRVYDASSLANIEGAVVRAQENPSRYAETDASGNYSFIIEPGSYTLLAAKDGYFPKTRALTGVVSAETKENQDFALTQMSSGTITGAAYIRDHLVISQVVGSSGTVEAEAEWVEVFNPTTWTWTMSTGLGTGANEIISLRYKRTGVTEVPLDLDYRSVKIAPNSYFLFANTGTVAAMGIVMTADAVYDIDSNFANLDDVINTGNPSYAGYIVLINAATGLELDKVGWNATNNGANGYAESYEGAPIDQAIGFQEGEEYTRRTASGGVTAGQGRCYDTQNNENDFVDTNPVANPPHNSSDSEACVSGTPAAGALVFTDDSLSSPVTANSTGTFNLTNVATGTWTVYLSSGSVFTSSGTFSGASNGFVNTTGNIILTSTTLYGYVTGLVTGVTGAALSGIKMYSAGAPQVATGSDGRYTLPAIAGVTTVIANYQNQSPSYLEFSSMNVTVALGAVTSNIDFTLSYGGKIRGKITTNGTDALPNVPVIAVKNGVEQGNGISGSDGYFTISGAGISTGTYQVAPQLDSGESCSPSSSTVVLTAGAVVFSDTYTVTGAFGYITGKVATGSESGPAITTGVLIYATTATITSTPPDINQALRSGTAVYYAGSSNALGAYSIPVRGGYTYNLYAWYTTWSGSAPTTTRKEYIGASAFTVNPSATVTKNFHW